jgi:hypothetical protein
MVGLEFDEVGDYDQFVNITPESRTEYVSTKIGLYERLPRVSSAASVGICDVTATCTRLLRTPVRNGVTKIKNEADLPLRLSHKWSGRRLTEPRDTRHLVHTYLKHSCVIK